MTDLETAFDCGHSRARASLCRHCQKTVKGKGVSFMENQVGWHGTAPNAEQYEQAMAELKRGLTGLEG